MSGNIYLGVDPPKYETQRAQARERLRAQAASQPVPEEEFLDHEEFIRFADEYQLALIQRRKKGCLFLLGQPTSPPFHQPACHLSTAPRLPV